jgi:hypothetical protein
VQPCCYAFYANANLPQSVPTHPCILPAFLPYCLLVALDTVSPFLPRYLHQLGQYYGSSKATFPNMFFMETPKQHFDSEDGDYKVGGGGDMST